MEGLIFGGARLRREICVSKSIGLASQLEGNLPFLLCFTLYLRAISKYKLPRGRGGGLIFGGGYTRRSLFSEFFGMSRNARNGHDGESGKKKGQRIGENL